MGAEVVNPLEMVGNALEDDHEMEEQMNLRAKFKASIDSYRHSTDKNRLLLTYIPNALKDLDAEKSNETYYATDAELQDIVDRGYVFVPEAELPQAEEVLPALQELRASKERAALVYAAPVQQQVALKAPSISISKMSSAKWNSIMDDTDMHVVFITDLPPSASSPAPAFVWDQALTESAQSARYMAHLATIFGNTGGLGTRLCWLDCTAKQQLLSVEPFSISGLKFRVSGTSDAAITLEGAEDNQLPALGLRGLFELKKVVTKRDIVQAMAELVAANIKATQLKPWCVATDLIDCWHLMWMDGRHICMIKFKGPEPRATAIGVIKDLLNNETAETYTQQLQVAAAAAAGTSVIYRRQELPKAAAVAEGMDNDVADLADLVDQLPEEEAFAVKMQPWLAKLRALLPSCQ